MDKTLSLQELASSIGDGERISFGGGGLVNKPMAAATAIGVAGASRLNVIAFLGGPEVDLLLGLGKVESLFAAYVGLDALGLAPNFRQARESGSLRFVETSESAAMTGLEAAARRLPFLPSRAPLASDVMNTPTSPYKTMSCPFTGQTLVAIPAIEVDTAIIHANEADRAGNAVIRSDAFADVLLAQAARRVFVTAERVVDELSVRGTAERRETTISRILVDGVCAAPRGGGLTGVYPEYPTDLMAVATYQKNGTDAEWLRAFAERGGAA